MFDADNVARYAAAGDTLVQAERTRQSRDIRRKLSLSQAPAVGTTRFPAKTAAKPRPAGCEQPARHARPASGVGEEIGLRDATAIGATGFHDVDAAGVDGAVVELNTLSPKFLLGGAPAWLRSAREPKGARTRVYRRPQPVCNYPPLFLRLLPGGQMSESMGEWNEVICSGSARNS